MVKSYMRLHVAVCVTVCVYVLNRNYFHKNHQSQGKCTDFCVMAYSQCMAKGAGLLQ